MSVRALGLAGLLVAVSLPLLARAAEPLILAPEDKARVQKIAADLICYCGCPRQTVADCVCGVADEIRGDIHAALGAGQTPVQIVDAYVAKRGTQFRATPEKKGLGLVAWIVPWASILVAGAVLLPLVKRWTRSAGAPASETAAARTTDPNTVAPQDAFRAQMERELDELD